MKNLVNKLKQISTMYKVGMLIGLFIIFPMASIILRDIIINGSNL